MSILLFKVTETYYLTDMGLALLPGLGNNVVPVGTPITIIRPDNTEIETLVKSITFHHGFPITVETHLSKEDVPIGSEVWARKTLTHDLSYYNYFSKGKTASGFTISFQHRVDKTFFRKLVMNDVAGYKDHINQDTTCLKLRIDMTPGSYAIDLALQKTNDEIRKFHEVLVFTDDECKNICFRCVAKDIRFGSERQC